MQTQNRVLDDLASLLTSLGSVTANLKTEADSAVRMKLERIASDLDLVPREEFDAVKEMVSNAMVRIKELEEQIARTEDKR